MSSTTGSSDEKEVYVEALLCKICDVQCSSPEDLKIHVLGKKHKKKLNISANSLEAFLCKLCDVQCSSAIDYDAHKFGKKHKKKLKEVCSGTTIRTFFCEVCEIDCGNNNNFEQHKLGKKHKKVIQKKRFMEEIRKGQTPEFIVTQNE